MTEPYEVAHPGEGTPGAVLGRAREAAGLTAADVATQMRISLRQLEAIEADRYDELPGTVFVRGFVRNYARLLNIDPAPLLHALEPALGGDAPLKAQHYEGAMPDTRSSRARLWLAAFLVLIALVLGAAVYEYWRGRTAAAPIVGAPSATPAQDSAATVRPSETPASGSATEPIPLAPERIGETAASPQESGSSTPTETGGASSVAAQRKPAPAGGPSRLQVAFVQESWLEVRDGDGKLLFSGTGAAGSEQGFDGAPPFTLVVGNASGVRITYNQLPVDVTGRAARNIARFTLE